MTYSERQLTEAMGELGATIDLSCTANTAGLLKDKLSSIQFHLTSTLEEARRSAAEDVKEEKSNDNDVEDFGFAAYCAGVEEGFKRALGMLSGALVAVVRGEGKSGDGGDGAENQKEEDKADDPDPAAGGSAPEPVPPDSVSDEKEQPVGDNAGTVEEEQPSEG